MRNIRQTLMWSPLGSAVPSVVWDSLNRANECQQVIDPSLEDKRRIGDFERHSVHVFTKLANNAFEWTRDRPMRATQSPLDCRLSTVAPLLTTCESRPLVSDHWPVQGISALSSRLIESRLTCLALRSGCWVRQGSPSEMVTSVQNLLA